VTTKLVRNEFEKVNLQLKLTIAMSAPYEKVLVVGATSGMQSIANLREI